MKSLELYNRVFNNPDEYGCPLDCVHWNYKPTVEGYNLDIPLSATLIHSGWY